MARLRLIILKDREAEIFDNIKKLLDDYGIIISQIEKEQYWKFDDSFEINIFMNSRISINAWKAFFTSAFGVYEFSEDYDSFTLEHYSDPVNYKNYAFAVLYIPKVDTT